jgi:hypothetical protein
MIPIEKRDSNPGLYFLQNLIVDCENVLNQSVEKHAKFGAATSKYLDNFTSLLLNMTYSLDDALRMAKIINVLE